LYLKEYINDARSQERQMCTIHSFTHLVPATYRTSVP